MNIDDAGLQLIKSALISVADAGLSVGKEAQQEQAMRDLSKHPSTENLAILAFEANERVRGLMIMNSPTDYGERRKAAVELALTRETAANAQRELDKRIREGA